jgi:hypothetical protein
MGAGSLYEASYVYGNNNPNMYVDPSGLRGIRSELVRFAGLVSRQTDPFLGGSNPVKYFGIDCADMISCKVAGEYADDHWDSKVLTGAAVRARTVYLAANYCKNLANSCQGRAAALSYGQANFQLAFTMGLDRFQSVPELPQFTPPGLGSGLASVEDVLANPKLLSGRSPLEVQEIIGDTGGWKVESLGKGSQKGNGWMFREYTERGDPTGRQIRWHPGGGHHGPLPYWKVVGFNGPSGEIR